MDAVARTKTTFHRSRFHAQNIRLTCRNGGGRSAPSAALGTGWAPGACGVSRSNLFLAEASISPRSPTARDRGHPPISHLTSVDAHPREPRLLPTAQSPIWCNSTYGGKPHAGDKSRVDFVGSTRGLKPLPPSGLSFWGGPLVLQLQIGNFGGSRGFQPPERGQNNAAFRPGPFSLFRDKEQVRR